MRCMSVEVGQDRCSFSSCSADKAAASMPLPNGPADLRRSDTQEREEKSGAPGPGIKVLAGGRKSDAAIDSDLKRWLANAFTQHQVTIQSLIETQHMNLSEDLERKLTLICEKLMTQPTSHFPHIGATSMVVPESVLSNAITEHPHAPTTLPPPSKTSVPGSSEKQDHAYQQQLGADTPNDDAKDDEHVMCYRVRKTMEHPLFDMFVGVLIILNTLTMVIQIQINGETMSYALGLRRFPSATVEDSHIVFDFVEHIFCALFLAELVLRLMFYRFKFFHDSFNVFDFVIVSATSADLYILQTLFDTGGSNLGIARLVRIFRVVRFLRVIRVAKRFSDLRILIKTLAASIRALLWSMVLVFIIILAGAICMAQLCSDYILEEGNLTYEVRFWLYERFGHATSAMWTMFEITFSGGWPNHVRPLIEEVNQWFCLFWLFYIVVVYFAVVRIIAAMFLKETMAISQNDKDMMAMETMKHADLFAGELRNFFIEADTSGDGLVSRDEFEDILTRPEVVESLKNLDLAVYEVQGLFNLLNDGDGTIPFEEFLSGAVRLKGAARSCDCVTIMHEQHKIRKEIVALHNLVLGVNLEEPAPKHSISRMVSSLQTIG